MSRTAPYLPAFLADSAGDSRIGTAVKLLREALEAAQDLRRDAWDFAVELRELREAGVTVTDLRWLVGIGYARHATERLRARAIRRSFRGARNLAFAEPVCFVLTNEGLQFADGLVHRRAAGRSRSGRNRDKPHWDTQRRRLSFRGQLVKQFRLPAANQEKILAALEEEGWPPRIDDPLPQVPEADPKVRFHDTIKSLNRNQVRPLLHFRGDGTGGGVIWEAVAGEHGSPELPQSAP